MPAQTVASPGQKNTVKVPRTGAKGVTGGDILVGRDAHPYDGQLGLSEFGNFLYNAFSGLWGDVDRLSPWQDERYVALTAEQVKAAGGSPAQVKAAIAEAKRFNDLRDPSWFKSIGKVKVPDLAPIDIGFLDDDITMKDLFIAGGVLVAGYFVIKMVKG